MGLFKKKEYAVLSPLSGRAIPLKDVNDPVFSQDMMGAGAAVVPNEGTLVSPIDGHIVLIAPTKHAIGISNDDGLEIMLHIGIDSFKTAGKGFDYNIKLNDSIKAGDLLGSIDLDYFEKENIDLTTVVIVLNKDYKVTNNVTNQHDIAKGECLLKYTK